MAHQHRRADRTTASRQARSQRDPGTKRLDDHRFAAALDDLTNDERTDSTDRPDDLPDRDRGPGSSGHDIDGLATAKAKKYVRPRNRVITYLVGAVLALPIAVLVLPYIDQLKNGADPDSTVTSAPAASPPSDTPAGSEPAPSTTSSLQPPTTGPWLLATYDSGGLHLTGTLPDDAALTAVNDAARLYGPLVGNEVVVDAAQPPAEWLATAPDVVTLLSRAISGSALIADGQVQLTVQAPTALVAERIEHDISNTTGLAVITVSTDITDQQAPVLTVTGTVSQVQLTGRVPTDAARDYALEAAVDVYGRGNVTSQVTVDETVHTALWMHDPHRLFEALYVFPEIDLDLNGETTTGYVRGGYSFSSGSADAVPEGPGVTQFVVDLMARDPSVQMLIEAHTDTDGPDDTNQALSQQRADTVAAYYTNAGIDPDRITAIGKGATTPLTDDTTPDGKNRNRRIEVKLTTLTR